MYTQSLIVVAHPGEETLSCARLLLRDPKRTFVLHIADGGTDDARSLRHCSAKNPREFAEIRKQELREAMQVLGVPMEHVSGAGLAERTVLQNIGPAVEAIVGSIRAEHPAEIHTHPFEGGHPDADAVCFAVHRALDLLRREGEVCPVLCEFTSYHARDGLFCAAEFLNPYPMPQITLLSEKECARKKEALRCFRSQYDLIARFSLCEERWRRADRYDFGERPHEGPLYYELSRSGFTWSDFARFVASMRDETQQ